MRDLEIDCVFTASELNNLSYGLMMAIQDLHDKPGPESLIAELEALEKKVDAYETEVRSYE